MTVKQLIRALQKFPMDADVGWQDHDSSEGELSSRVEKVCEFNPDGSQDPRWTKNIRVVIR